MIHSVFELGDTIAREVMVPRTDMVYIERYKNLRQTLSLFLRSGFSRVPVIGENLDDVVGIAYLKDIVRRDFEAPDVEITQRVEEVMRPAHFVPESKPVDALLSEMQAIRQHIAIVVDEYGGTAGLVTIEDILEEIVGEITDEYDEEEVEVEPLDDGGDPGLLALPGRRPRRAVRLRRRGRRRRQRRRPDGQAPRPGADPGLPRRGARAALRGRGDHRPPQPDRHRADQPGRRRGGRAGLPTTLMVMSETASGLSAEDTKLVTLARATRARVAAEEGAAVRDADGRTYAAATVDLPSLQLSALDVCIAMAVASGSRGLEAAVVLTEAERLSDGDLAAVREFAGHEVAVHRADPRGSVRESLVG